MLPSTFKQSQAASIGQKVIPISPIPDGDPYELIDL